MCGRLQRNHSLLDRIKTSQVGPYRKKTQQLLAADEEQVCESLLSALSFFIIFFFLVGSTYFMIGSQKSLTPAWVVSDTILDLIFATNCSSTQKANC